MFKTLIVLVIAGSVLAAELPRHNLQEHAYNPDPMGEPVSTHPVSKKASEPELDPRPIYRAEEKTGRVRMEPVKPNSPVVKYDQMLADQSNEAPSEVNRIDKQQIPNYAFVPTQPEVAYPDVLYAPAYSYENGYPQSVGYDAYGTSVGNYFEPDMTPFGLLWSQVPDSRTIVSYVGRSIYWMFSSIFVLLLGSFLTVGVCSYTNLCTISFNGVSPIEFRDEMRSYITPERLENISTAATLVKSAIDKYQKIQKVDAVKRRRRAIFY